MKKIMLGLALVTSFSSFAANSVYLIGETDNKDYICKVEIMKCEKGDVYRIDRKSKEGGMAYFLSTFDTTFSYGKRVMTRENGTLINKANYSNGTNRTLVLRTNGEGKDIQSLEVSVTGKEINYQQIEQQWQDSTFFDDVAFYAKLYNPFRSKFKKYNDEIKCHNLREDLSERKSGLECNF